MSLATTAGVNLGEGGTSQSGQRSGRDNPPPVVDSEIPEVEESQPKISQPDTINTHTCSARRGEVTDIGDSGVDWKGPPPARPQYPIEPEQNESDPESENDGMQLAIQEDDGKFDVAEEIIPATPLAQNPRFDLLNVGSPDTQVNQAPPVTPEDNTTEPDTTHPPLPARLHHPDESQPPLPASQENAIDDHDVDSEEEDAPLLPARGSAEEAMMIGSPVSREQVQEADPTTTEPDSGSAVTPELQQATTNVPDDLGSDNATAGANQDNNNLPASAEDTQHRPASSDRPNFIPQVTLNRQGTAASHLVQSPSEEDSTQTRFEFYIGEEEDADAAAGERNRSRNRRRKKSRPKPQDRI